MRFTVIGCLLLIALSAVGQSGCEIKLDKDSILIHQCKVADSKFKAIQASFRVKSSLSQLAAIVMDVEGHVDWEYKAINARTLKQVSEREVIFYTEVSAPFITTNRDYIVQLKISQDPRTKVMMIDANSLPGYLPEQKGKVRIPYSKAHWIVRAISPTVLDVVYYLEVDIGGSVPPWIANAVSAQGPYETFKAMRERIGAYQGKGSSFIKD